ncbi:CpaF/VirB11 family protein [Ruminococcus sp. OA3]|uniref:CpaF/VirB11 family protein n=1 Tax=Ruminococcus sp. OA3 TaxID=2914164 RepID=UPI001F05DF7E|nr:CpaF/VirB11 family protein [Ruminococcus sp. OA3]MCH1981877.1 CpaF/VirB11 family protein [Ruminococcus sp. OA3]
MARISNWHLPDESYGVLLPYIRDDNVTDINYNGKEVWVDDVTRGRYRADIVVDKDFEKQFVMRIKNAVSANFNPQDNILEAETEDLRVSVIHESIAHTGTAISIRKSPPVQRLTDERMVKEGYCSVDIMNFLKNCIAAHCNVVVCGLTGSGKTELLKWLTRSIPAHERVITIEDNLEIHYRAINPGKDCVELKVHEELFSYTKAIKACLRQFPQWILLSEARSVEVKYLLEAFSTGHYGLTTLHTDDVRHIPDRIENMMQDALAAARMENDIYNFINVGVLISKKAKEDGKIHRYISQICLFNRESQNNEIQMLVDDGIILKRMIPNSFCRKFLRAKIQDPFSAF